MSRISAGLKKTIDEIKRLSDGSIDDQLKACEEFLHKKIFPFGKLKPGIPVSVISELLPTIIKFMESNDHILQEEGAYFVLNITCTPDEKTNTKLVIDAGVIPKLVVLLSSTNTNVLVRILKTIANIAYDFPEMVVENEILQSMIQYLKSEKEEMIYPAARFIYNIACGSDEHVAAIFEADGVKPLIEILESKNYDAIKYALATLIHIIYCKHQYCQLVLNLDALKSLKKLCDRLYYSRTLRDKKRVEFLVIRLIRNISYYGEAQVNVIINENFLPIILQQIKGGVDPEIKIESIKVIENVIDVKRNFIPALVQEYKILSLLYDTLQNTNVDLLIAALTAMSNIVEFSEGRDSIRQKIRECGDPRNLSNLFEHSNEEIRHLSTMLYEFVFDVKPDPIAGVSGENNQQEPEVIELNSEDDDTLENPQPRYQRKRPANTPPSGPLRRSKRFKVSLEQRNTDNIDNSSSDEDGNDQNNDFDDHPINFSPAGAAPIVSNRHDHFRPQSFVGDDTVTATDQSTRLNPKAEPTPQNVYMPATSASHQVPDLPVAFASTMNETVQNERKPSVVGRLGNRLRRASNHSHVKPEPASSTSDDGNIRDTQAGRQIVVDSETAATFDGIVRNGSDIAPALPVASASTNNGIMPNDIPSRKPSPVHHQPVITFVLPNQVTPPPTPAANNDIVRDEIIKYWRPAEFLIDQYCDTLEIQFNRKDYDEFIPKIEFTQITSNSKPANIFQSIDQTGFGCLSILLTGNEDVASTIRMKVNKKFINDLDKTGNFDDEKIAKVIALPHLMKEEHLETIAAWLKCRILVYCNGWKKYGSWDTDDQMIPIFVLEKKEIEAKTEYSIVWTLKND